MSTHVPARDGRPFRAWREAAGLTRERVAGAAGVTARTIENWELGRATPRTEHVHLMAPLAPGLLEALGLGGQQ